jgi:ribosomal protein S18 acetylase RimI-like enzyme
MHMTGHQFEIAPIRLRDLLSVTRMTHENMTGVDRQFTRLVSSRSGYLASHLLLPMNLLFAGSGYKAMFGREMIGCAYLNLSKRSGYVFNVSVRRQYRRRNVGRLLMEHLEAIAWNNRRRWMTLQVDDGNVAAQRLYESLNYFAFHPRYFAGRPHDFKGLRASPDLELEKLSPLHGRRLFTRYLEIEHNEGDPWASRIAGDVVPSPSLSGDSYRCLVAKEEIGCILTQRKGDGLRIELALRPDMWGNPIALTAIKSILEAQGVNGSKIEVHLGSNRHHEKAAAFFTDLGLDERFQERILMLKQLKS